MSHDLVTASAASVPATGTATSLPVLIGRAGGYMRRFRLSTLMLLIVIAALSIALVMQHRREARLRMELERREYDLETARNYVQKKFNEKLEQKLIFEAVP